MDAISKANNIIGHFSHHQPKPQLYKDTLDVCEALVEAHDILSLIELSSYPGVKEWLKKYATEESE